jgi:hypothetical protein
LVRRKLALIAQEASGQLTAATPEPELDDPDDLEDEA